MPNHSWTLTDVERGIHENDFHAAASELPDAAGTWKISQRTLQGGLSQGVDLLVVDNGRIRLLVLPTRGMGIWRVETAGESILGWKSPNRGPVHPSFVPLYDPTGLGWLEGFDELLVRCGLESNGAPEFDERGQLVYPLHGRIANRPAHRVTVTVDEDARTISVCGLVEETRFHFQKLRLEATLTTSFDSPRFTISDRVHNFGGTPAEMQMLYHLNVGEPLLGPGAQFVAPAKRVTPAGSRAAAPEDWNEYGPAIAGAAEQCYTIDLANDSQGQSSVLLKSADGTQGTAVAFNTKQLPCFTLWKNLVASEDGYVTGLEPATNYPNCRSAEAEAGRIVPLDPGASWGADIAIDWLTTADEVSAAESSIKQLQASRL